MNYLAMLASKTGKRRFACGAFVDVVEVRQGRDKWVVFVNPKTGRVADLYSATPFKLRGRTLIRKSKIKDARIVARVAEAALALYKPQERASA